ncbi:MAG: hypothetical protein LBO74_00465 [Candidatus Symbiothrix sp.]|jgi:hypothetical protein|nr:hypothetical protein [Candidatus Symbiothrix sp.]
MKKEWRKTFDFDPAEIRTFTDLIDKLSKKAVPEVRKKGFENYLKYNKYKVFEYKEGNIYVIQGAKYNESEFHIAEKLVKAGYHVLFPNEGDLGGGRKNDLYLYDTKTYIQTKAELKSLFGNTAQSVRSNLISGSGQASVIVYDIQSNIKKNWLIAGLRSGWSEEIKRVMLNWHGQWYEINKEFAFKKGWLEYHLK